MDIELNYIEKGAGQTIIFLHGNGENHKYFINQIDFFAENYHIIALDTRGHGDSARGKEPFTIVQFAEDLHSFMISKGIKKAHILGFSDGGNIALYFALKYPEMIYTLTLNGANLYPTGVKATAQIPIVIGFGITCLFQKFSSNALKKKEMLGLMVKEPHIKPSQLSKIKIPTLVIAGTKDLIKESHTKLIYNSIPDAKLAILEGNHCVAYNNPADFNKTVFKFLTDNAVNI